MCTANEAQDSNKIFFMPRPSPSNKRRHLTQQSLLAVAFRPQLRRIFPRWTSRTPVNKEIIILAYPLTNVFPSKNITFIL